MRPVAPGATHAGQRGDRRALERQAAIDRHLLFVERVAGRRLLAHQRASVVWLAPRRVGLLGHHMGLGKTACVLAALPRRAATLVVVPPGARGVWLREAQRWRPDLDASAVSRRADFRWPRAGELVVVTYGRIPRQALAIPIGLILVADEVHEVRSEDAARARRFRALARAVRRARGRTWGVTGTPLLNRADDLWWVLAALGCAIPAFGSREDFDRLVEAGAVGPALQRVMLRFGQGVLAARLPPLARRLVTVPIPEADRARVRVALDRLRDRGISPAAIIRAAARARRASVALPGRAELAEVRAALARAKVPALVRIVDRLEAAGRPLLVFSAHRDPVRVLGRRPGWVALTGEVSAAGRERIAADFQAGRLRGIASTIRAGGVALTLTRAADCIFVDRSWTPAWNAQAEGRLHRLGQRRPCRVLVFVADHAVDRRVAEVLEEKVRLVDETVEAASATR